MITVSQPKKEIPMNKHPFAVAMLFHVLKDLFKVQTSHDIEELKELVDSMFDLISDDKEISADDMELFAKALVVYEALELEQQVENDESHFMLEMMEEIFEEDEDKQVKLTCKPLSLDTIKDDESIGRIVEITDTKDRDFDFYNFIQKLYNHKDKSEIVEKYKECMGIDLLKVQSVEELPLYKDYLVHFDTKDIKLFAPENSTDIYDLDLLLRLVVSSFSSSWKFEFVEDSDAMRLWIKVCTADKSVDKYLDMLLNFQIARMYEIYIEEQINLEIMKFEDEREAYIVESQREDQLKKYDAQLSRYRKHTMLVSLQGGER